MRTTEDSDRIIRNTPDNRPVRTDSTAPEYPDDDDYASYAALLDQHVQRAKRNG